jgi:Transposase IS66 family
VEPTNNHAERALRSAVIYRKLSLGSQSDGGELRTTHSRRGRFRNALLRAISPVSLLLGWS